jgi:hypothetical protein
MPVVGASGNVHLIYGHSVYVGLYLAKIRSVLEMNSIQRKQCYTSAAMGQTGQTKISVGTRAIKMVMVNLKTIRPRFTPLP